MCNLHKNIMQHCSRQAPISEVENNARISFPLPKWQITVMRSAIQTKISFKDLIFGKVSKYAHLLCTVAPKLLIWGKKVWKEAVYIFYNDLHRSNSHWQQVNHEKGNFNKIKTSSIVKNYFSEASLSNQIITTSIKFPTRFARYTSCMSNYYPKNKQIRK